MVGEVHARMPVILPPDAYDAWLDPELQDLKVLQPLLVPAPSGDWEGYYVGCHTRDDKPKLIERQEEHP